MKTEKWFPTVGILNLDVHTRDGTLKKGMKDETFFFSCYATNKNLRKEFNGILQSIPYLFRNDFKKFGIVWGFCIPGTSSLLPFKCSVIHY